MLSRHSKADLFQLVLLVVTAALITATGIIFRQSFIRILPLYNSLVVMLLVARVNRYAYLVGACNALLYGYIYFSFKLYASMVYAVCISSPIQLASFILWGKKPWGRSTILKRLTGKQRSLVGVGFVMAWAAVMALLSLLGSSYQVLDTTITLVGILASVLTMLAYVEYAYLVFPSTILSIVLYALMLQENPAQITYLIYTVYCLICQLTSLQRVRKLYRLQQKKAV